jgi:hypothetical protein
VIRYGGEISFNRRRLGPLADVATDGSSQREADDPEAEEE